MVGSVGLGVLECKGHLMDLLLHVPYLFCQLMPGGCFILCLLSPRWDLSPQTHNETHLGQLLTYGISSDPDHCLVNVHEHRALILQRKGKKPQSLPHSSKEWCFSIRFIGITKPIQQANTEKEEWCVPVLQYFTITMTIKTKHMYKPQIEKKEKKKFNKLITGIQLAIHRLWIYKVKIGRWNANEKRRDIGNFTRIQDKKKGLKNEINSVFFWWFFFGVWFCLQVWWVVFQYFFWLYEWITERAK